MSMELSTQNTETAFLLILIKAQKSYNPGIFNSFG